MDAVSLRSVTKVFRHRPALFNLLGQEKSGQTRALNDVSLTVTGGEVVVLLGANGSGKTTTLKLISTMLLPDAGQVCVNGHDTLSAPDQVRRNVAFVVAAERSFYPRLSGRENLHFFAALEEVPRPSREERISTVLGLMELGPAADTLVMKYSTGMYQRLGIARALLKQPPVLLLDEPSRSLDPGAAEHLWELVRGLRAGGTTIVLATHNFAEAVAVGNAVAVLDAGGLAARQPLAAHTSAEHLRQFYKDAVGGEDRPLPLSRSLP